MKSTVCGIKKLSSTDAGTDTDKGTDTGVIDNSYGFVQRHVRACP